MSRVAEIIPYTVSDDADFLFCLLQKDEVKTDLLERRSAEERTRALQHTNRLLADKLREKDEVIAWLSGCYSVNTYLSE